MRILIVSDIHGNWPALRAVQEPFDACLCLGDLVDYGLEPAPCIEWARNHATYAVRGNHDHGVAHDVLVYGQRGYKWLTAVTRPISRARLGPNDRRYLAALPPTRWFALENHRWLICHASPRDPLDEYGPCDQDFWARRLQHIDADIVCVGHTHQPYVLEVGGKLVINPGSLGLPRDGDPRGSYAVMENKRVELKRFPYPVEDTVRVVLDSPLADDAKAVLTEVYRTGGGLYKPEPRVPRIRKVAPARPVEEAS
jgi:putative phosphoesterase